MTTNNPKIKTILKAAREILQDEKRWTKGYFARTAAGDRVESCNKAAVCYCAMGAIDKAAVEAREPRFGVGDDAIDALAKFLPDGHQKSVASFNDNPKTTHAEVLALFDQAIAKLES